MEQHSRSNIIYEYTKDEQSAARQETAKQAIEARRQARENRAETSEIQQQTEELRNKIDHFSKNAVRRLLNFRQLKALRQQLGEKDARLADLQEQSKDIVEAKQLTQQFYENMKKNWREAGYTREIVEKYFTADRLASLNVDEYGTLLSRFRKDIATHVTRQGVRDHANEGHVAGLGELHNGLKGILESKRLHSMLSVQTAEHDLEDMIYKEMEKSINTNNADYERQGWSKREALQNFFKLISNPGVGWATYTDKAAIHFGHNAVLDGIYGAERENEAFFIYPMQLLTAEYIYRESPRDDVNFHNDLWIWTQEQQGLDLNTSVLFLPKNTPVDRQTGSRYITNESGEPLVDTESAELLSNQLSLPETTQFIIQASEELRQQGYIDNETSYHLRELLAPNDKVFSDELRYDLSLIIHSLREQVEQGGESRNIAQFILQSAGRYYKRSTDTVLAEEYWETYFNAHPDQKPNKIVYYDGTPTQGLNNWLNRHQIRKYHDPSKPASSDLFPDHKVHNENRPYDIAYGQQEYYEVGMQIIDKFAPETIETAEEPTRTDPRANG